LGFNDYPKFTIDYDIDGVGSEIAARDMLTGRLRRIAATTSEITGEILMLNWTLVYVVDKMYGLQV